jgi:hypothetical protein
MSFATSFRHALHPRLSHGNSKFRSIFTLAAIVIAILTLILVLILVLVLIPAVVLDFTSADQLVERYKVKVCQIIHMRLARALLSGEGAGVIFGDDNARKLTL